MPVDPSTQAQYCYYSEGTNGKSFRLFTKLENCSDPDVYNPSTCASDPYNFSVASTDLTIAQASIAPPPPPPPPPPPSYKRVFVTSNSYTGDLRAAGSNVGLGAAIDGPDGADKICQSRANAASLGGTWKAWISGATTAQSAASRLVHSSIPYKLLNGTTVANNWADLTDGTLLAPINRTESNGLVTNNGAWTNTKPDGSTTSTFQTGTCGGFTNGDGTYGGAPFGLDNVISSDWTWNNASAEICDYGLNLYCFEQ